MSMLMTMKKICLVDTANESPTQDTNTVQDTILSYLISDKNP